MKEEYCFNLTAPLSDLEKVQALLAEARKQTPSLRISRKTDRAGCARFYLSFPLTASRPDLAFQKWFLPLGEKNWELFGPHYGRWGFVDAS